METTTTRNLKCVLTEEELKKISEQMANAVLERDEALDGLKSVQAQFKARITGAEAQISLCASKIQNGYEYRNVECAIERDYLLGEIRYFRKDTGEKADSRSMTADERQQDLFKE
jgi:hypothetical protein